MRLHLTEIAVRALKPKPDKQFKAWDTTTPGFGVLVSEHSKSWIVMHGARRALKVLGRYPDASLANARAEAKRILATGSLAHAAARVVRFDEAFREYIEEVQQRSRPRTLRDYKRLIAQHFNFGTTPLPGDHPAGRPQACRRDQEHAGRATIRARRLQDIHGMVRTALLSESSPCARLQAPGAATTRERVLTDAELAAVLLQARKTPYPFGAIVELLILTGQRRGEIAALRWEWIDDEAKTITLPSSITKNKRPHTFPYGELASAVFAAIPRVNEYPLPCRPRPPEGQARDDFQRLEQAQGRCSTRRARSQPWTLHDLRRTFATNLAALGTPIHVTEKLLNHISGTVSGVAAIYNRHAYLDEMRAAIDAWEKRLSFILAQHNSDNSNGSPLP